MSWLLVMLAMFAGSERGDWRELRAPTAAVSTMAAEDAEGPTSGVEERVACLESRCQGCTDADVLVRKFGGDQQRCLRAFKACAQACGCNNFGPHISRLEDACR